MALGEIFIFDMGDPVKIIDLAKKMIRLAGFTPDKEIKIKIVGLRPGEKLFEELLIGNDPKPTGHPRIMKANEKSISKAELDQEVETLQNILRTRDVPELKNLLLRLVDGYQPEIEAFDALAEMRKPGISTPISK